MSIRILHVKFVAKAFPSYNEKCKRAFYAIYLSVCRDRTAMYPETIFPDMDMCTTLSSEINKKAAAIIKKSHSDKQAQQGHANTGQEQAVRNFATHLREIAKSSDLAKWQAVLSAFRKLNVMLNEAASQTTDQLRASISKEMNRIAVDMQYSLEAPIRESTSLPENTARAFKYTRLVADDTIDLLKKTTQHAEDNTKKAAMQPWKPTSFNGLEETTIKNTYDTSEAPPQKKGRYVSSRCFLCNEKFTETNTGWRPGSCSTACRVAGYSYHMTCLANNSLEYTRNCGKNKYEDKSQLYCPQPKCRALVNVFLQSSGP